MLTYSINRSPTRKSTIVAASHLPIMSNMELAYLKEINDRCPINYEEEIRNYELSTAYAQQIRDSTSKETRENYGHHTTLPPVIVQERPSLRYDNEPVAGSSKHFIGQSMGAGSSSNIHRFKVNYTSTYYKLEVWLQIYSETLQRTLLGGRYFLSKIV